MDIASLTLLACGLYAMTGVAVGAWFVVARVHRVDPASHRASWGFRAIIFPGCAAMWPLVLRWALRGSHAGSPAEGGASTADITTHPQGPTP